MNNFDLKKFLIENKLTTRGRLMFEEPQTTYYIYKLTEKESGEFYIGYRPKSSELTKRGAMSIMKYADREEGAPGSGEMKKHVIDKNMDEDAFDFEILDKTSDKQEAENIKDKHIKANLSDKLLLNVRGGAGLKVDTPSREFQKFFFDTAMKSPTGSYYLVPSSLGAQHPTYSGPYKDLYNAALASEIGNNGTIVDNKLNGKMRKLLFGNEGGAYKQMVALSKGKPLHVFSASKVESFFSNSGLNEAHGEPDTIEGLASSFLFTLMEEIWYTQPVDWMNDTYDLGLSDEEIDKYSEPGIPGKSEGFEKIADPAVERKLIEDPTHQDGIWEYLLWPDGYDEGEIYLDQFERLFPKTTAKLKEMDPSDAEDEIIAAMKRLTPTQQ